MAKFIKLYTEKDASWLSGHTPQSHKQQSLMQLTWGYVQASQARSDSSDMLCKLFAGARSLGQVF